MRMYQLPYGGVMAAVADEEVLGKTAYDGESGLSLIVSEEFYKGELVDEEKVERILAGADVLVLAGDRVIGKAVSMGLLEPSSVLRIGGLSHAQVFKFSV